MELEHEAVELALRLEQSEAEARAQELCEAGEIAVLGSPTMPMVRPQSPEIARVCVLLNG